MGPFAAGQVVSLTFPYSDLSRNKLRAVLLLAYVDRYDWISCLITSNPYADPKSITLADADFAIGGLQRISYLRPGKFFTASESFIAACPGSLHPATLEKVQDAVVAIIRGNSIH